jgi:hypothetical protein
VGPLQALEQGVLGAINTPTELALGRPLIGHGTDGTTNAQGATEFDAASIPADFSLPALTRCQALSRVATSRAAAPLTCPG